MKIAALSLMTPLRVSTTLMLVVCVYLGWWCFALALHGLSADGVRSLLWPAAALAVTAVAMQLNTLGAAMRVLSSRRTPFAFNRAVLRDGLLQLGLGYGLLAGSAALHFHDPKPGVHPLAVTALLSLLACASAAAVLAARRHPSLVAAIVAGLALLAVDSQAGGSGPIAAFNAMHGLTLACLSLLWPLATVLAALHPATPECFGRWMAHSRPDTLWQWLATLVRRITFLTWQPLPGPAGRTAFGGSAQWVGPILAIVFVPRLVLAPADGSDYDMQTIVAVVLALTNLCDAIPALDLHWRGVLAPGGWRAGSIGVRLWRTGAAFYGGAVLACYASLFALDAALGNPVDRGGLERLCVAVAETVWLVAVAVTLRGGVPTRWTPISALLLSPVLALGLSNQLPWVVALRASSTYVPALLALTAVCVLLANRLWNIDKLMAAARS